MNNKLSDVLCQFKKIISSANYLGVIYENTITFKLSRHGRCSDAKGKIWSRCDRDIFWKVFKGLNSSIILIGGNQPLCHPPTDHSRESLKVFKKHYLPGKKI